MPASARSSLISSTPSAQTAAPVVLAKRASASSSASFDASAWMPADQRAVDLDDVRAQADQLLEPGVARAGVVERDPRAALAQRRERELERAVLVERLVLGELDRDRRRGRTAARA